MIPPGRDKESIEDVHCTRIVNLERWADLNDHEETADFDLPMFFFFGREKGDDE